ncbi:MAG: FAD-dependent oxidoreductase [Leptolyngbya sp.]|nr:FAD-dependent oxidoreductase [Candidatus Melainabacteria bacterium]
MLPVEQSCYWLATRQNYTPAASLSGQVDADYVIVGGGFTGLWTALFLKQLEPQAHVVVVESSVSGYGASGRNAGIISSSIDHSHALAITHFGKPEAERLAKIGLQNISELENFADNCDFERTGQLQVALKPAHLDYCHHNVEVAEQLNIAGYRVLGQDEMQAEVNSPLYIGGLFVPGGGVLNPIKLVDKIVSSMSSLGVQLYEKTRVLKIEDGRITCENGSINARKIVMATDAYTHHLLPQLLWRFIPLYDYILVSDPLSAEQKDAIRWHHRQGLVDLRTFFNYYRLTSDDRILWGTSEAVYYPPNKVDASCDHSEHHYTTLRESFKKHFPHLGNVDFPYGWGGPIASTTRLTPFFGKLMNDNVIYGLGYTGHGIGTTRVAGKILAHMAASKDSDLLSLKMVTDKPFPYPPEPIRGMSVNAVTHSLQKVDAGENPNILLKMLDMMGIGFSS